MMIGAEVRPYQNSESSVVAELVPGIGGKVLRFVHAELWE